MTLVVCVDFGSTYTKAGLVDTDTGALLATASHRTTIDTDVLDGFDACRSSLEQTHPEARSAEVLACSSAGGGLRIAVVGNEELVTAEAGRRVALSSGGKVVAVLSQPHGALDLGDPDVVLLTGGTDGGNDEVILDAAGALVASGWTGPVVVAGNSDARVAVAEVLRGLPLVFADNVMPRIGVLNPEPARKAIRELFLSHVIGGKHLSARTDFTAMVRGATPDVVLTGVELLASAVGDLAVVDIGGATTDVHSVVELDPDNQGREIVATTRVTRTVEGDLGMRWSAVTTAEAAIAAGLADQRLLESARALTPKFLPTTDEDRTTDRELATAAAVLAVRRHVGRSQVVLGPGGRVLERTGKDLREIDVLIGSGGVLRYAEPKQARAILEAATGETTEGWQQPEHPRIVIDVDYVLAAAGLLAENHPEAAVQVALSCLA